MSACCALSPPCVAIETFSLSASINGQTVYLPYGLTVQSSDPYVLRLRAPSVVIATLTLDFNFDDDSETAYGIVEITPRGQDAVSQRIAQYTSGSSRNFAVALQQVLSAGTFYVQGVVTTSNNYLDTHARLDIQTIPIALLTKSPVSCCVTPATIIAKTFVLAYVRDGDVPGLGVTPTAYLPHSGETDSASNVLIPAPYTLRLTAPSLVSAKLYADALVTITGTPATYQDVFDAVVTITRVSDGETFTQSFSTTVDNAAFGAATSSVQVTLNSGAYTVQSYLVFSAPTPTPDAYDVTQIDARLNVLALPL